MKTGHTSGKVLSTNVTITFSSGATISNLTSADYESGPGDSGCVVYSISVLLVPALHWVFILELPAVARDTIQRQMKSMLH